MTDARTLATRFLEHLGRGESEEAAGLFADEVDFVVPHDPAVWWIPEVRVRHDFERFLAGLGQELDTLEFEVTTIVADGDDVVVLGRFRERVVKTGREFSSPFSIHLTVAEGRLTRFHMMEDSAAVAKAATG